MAFFPPQYARSYGYSYLYPHLYKRRDRYTYEWSRLQRRGLIQKNGDIYRLTSKGEKEAFFAFLEAGKRNYQPHKERWDGHWRIIFFDIPEKQRRMRDELRDMLKTIGFKEFQQSVWIYPYRVPNFLKEILFEERIKHFTRFITTKHIEYDKDLRKVFKLA